MSNRLAGETSPYLLQHAENPVDWYPWCSEAFDRAKDEDKPIFLSIGYSTCHWCHVMAHESFENPEIAAILNENYICIKVDREERPDIDSVYMSVCHALTGSGGWPMSLFMTWDKQPFFAGTYFPPNTRHGLPSFRTLLFEIIHQWRYYRASLLDRTSSLLETLSKTPLPSSESHNLIGKAIDTFSNSFDTSYGGFGAPPKFPASHTLLFLLYHAHISDDKQALFMAEKTLNQMQRGGLFDHIGFGFSRYSTDRFFLVPHFEKMLYDNAFLIMAYSAAFALTGKSMYLDTAEKTALYIFREMTMKDGRFYSAQDADSDGVEGKYYTFTFDEILNVLGEENGRRFASAFDITPEGNFNGTNIPNRLKCTVSTANFDDEIAQLYRYRKSRTFLHTDDKVLLSWNAMMMAALSMLYRVSQKEQYLTQAIKAQSTLEKTLASDEHLYTSCRGNHISSNAFLDDYAYYTAALLELYNSTLNEHYLTLAKRYCSESVKQFSDAANGGFYLNKTASSDLPFRPKETQDGAVPSGNSIMAYNFVRLYQLTGDEWYNSHAKAQLNFLSKSAADYPAGQAMFLLAKELYENPPKHIVVAAKNNGWKNTMPRFFLANISVSSNKQHRLLNGLPTFYVCDNQTCYPPSNYL